MPFLIVVRCRDRPAKSKPITKFTNTVSMISLKTSREITSKANGTIDYSLLTPSPPIAKTLSILWIGRALFPENTRTKPTKLRGRGYKRCCLVVYLARNKKIAHQRRVHQNWVVKAKAEQLYQILQT